MKTYFTILLAVFFLGVGLAQDTDARYFGIKNYFSFEIEKADINFIRTNNQGFELDSVQHFDIKIVRPAFNIFTKKGHFHEFEITTLKFLEEETETYYLFTDPQFGTFDGYFRQGTEKLNEFGLRYQFNYALVNKKVKVLLGAGIEGLLKTEKFIPIIPEDRATYSGIEWKHTIKGLNLQVVPRIIIPLNEKLFIDINALVTVYQLERVDYDRWQKIDVPVFVNFKHTIKNVLPIDIEGAIGIGYKIERKKR